MAVSAGFLETVAEILGFAPEFRIKRMFGGAGVFSGELMFALADDEELYLRADDTNRPDFEAAGCSQFVFESKAGETMTLGYWRAPSEVWDDPESARRWAGRSLEAAARKKASQKKGKRKAPVCKPPELLISGPWDED